MQIKTFIFCLILVNMAFANPMFQGQPGLVEEPAFGARMNGGPDEFSDFNFEPARAHEEESSSGGEPAMFDVAGDEGFDTHPPNPENAAAPNHGGDGDSEKPNPNSGRAPSSEGEDSTNESDEPRSFDFDIDSGFDRPSGERPGRTERAPNGGGRRRPTNEESAGEEGDEESAGPRSPREGRFSMPYMGEDESSGAPPPPGSHPNVPRRGPPKPDESGDERSDPRSYRSRGPSHERPSRPSGPPEPMISLEPSDESVDGERSGPPRNGRSRPPYRNGKKRPGYSSPPNRQSMKFVTEHQPDASKNMGHINPDARTFDDAASSLDSPFMPVPILHGKPLPNGKFQPKIQGAEELDLYSARLNGEEDGNQSSGEGEIDPQMQEYMQKWISRFERDPSLIESLSKSVQNINYGFNRR